MLAAFDVTQLVTVLPVERSMAYKSSPFVPPRCRRIVLIAELTLPAASSPTACASIARYPFADTLPMSAAYFGDADMRSLLGGRFALSPSLTAVQPEDFFPLPPAFHSS